MHVHPAPCTACRRQEIITRETSAAGYEECEDDHPRRDLGSFPDWTARQSDIGEFGAAPLEGWLMNDDADKQAEANEEVERELRQGRKFSPTEALARMAGPGAMKGASPVSPVRQAETEISNWLGSNLADSGGALKVVLCRHLGGSRLLLDNLDRPLAALEEYCRALLAAEPRLKEIVREADIEWGRAMGERPFFDREGAPPNPDDPYTAQKVRQAIEAALERLPGGTA